METVNYSNFRSNLKYWFDKVINDVSDVIIKRKGRKDLVLITLDEYNSLKETIYLLSGKKQGCFIKFFKGTGIGFRYSKNLID